MMKFRPRFFETFVFPSIEKLPHAILSKLRQEFAHPFEKQNTFTFLTGNS